MSILFFLSTFPGSSPQSCFSAILLMVLQFIISSQLSLGGQTTTLEASLGAFLGGLGLWIGRTDRQTDSADSLFNRKWKKRKKERERLKQKKGKNRKRKKEGAFSLILRVLLTDIMREREERNDEKRKVYINAELSLKSSYCKMDDLFFFSKIFGNRMNSQKGKADLVLARCCFFGYHFYHCFPFLQFKEFRR